MIEADDLHKTFGRIGAVRGVTLSAADGAITGLLGPNGAGKTTTLRMLYTLLTPDQGSVRIDGVDARSDAVAARRRLGVLPDSRGLYKRMSARENVEYFGRLQGLDESTLRLNCEKLIEQLDMREIADRPTGGFSQGQRVKTALARALVHGPQNLLLDEPTNGLDVMATRALRGFLREMRDAGRCIVFSSHIMQEVAALCDQVIVIARGQVVATGTPDELREQAGESNLEDAFMKLIGSSEGLVS